MSQHRSAARSRIGRSAVVARPVHRERGAAEQGCGLRGLKRVVCLRHGGPNQPTDSVLARVVTRHRVMVEAGWGVTP